MRIISIYSITNDFKIALLVALIILTIGFTLWSVNTFLEDERIIVRAISVILSLLSFLGIILVAELMPDYLQNKYGYYVEIIDEDNVDLSKYNIIEVHGNIYQIEDK